MDEEAQRLREAAKKRVREFCSTVNRKFAYECSYDTVRLVPDAPYYPRRYLDETYSIMVPESGEAHAMMWHALAAKNPIAIDFAMAHLAQKEIKRMTFAYNSSTRSVEPERPPPKNSIRGTPGADAPTETQAEAAASTFRSPEVKDPPTGSKSLTALGKASFTDLVGHAKIKTKVDGLTGAEAMLIDASNDSQFPRYTDFVALFLAGYGDRGAISRQNQHTRGFEMCRMLAGYNKPVAQFCNLDFLRDTRNSHSQSKLAAALACFYMESEHRFTYERMIMYAIIQPVCNASMTLYRRYKDFDHYFPGVLFKTDFPMLRISDVHEAALAIAKILGVIRDAEQRGQETEIFAIRRINQGVFSFLSREDVKRGDLLLFIAICEATPDGRQKWADFWSNAWARRLFDNATAPCMLRWARAALK